MKESRVFGPPGTGKTSRLATRDVPQAVAKYGPSKVMVVSFTKTAAMEIASKKSRDTGEVIPVDPQNVGTLHAICYRNLGQPEIAEAHKNEWNEIHGRTFPIAGTIKGGIDDGGMELLVNSKGDQCLAELAVSKATMKPLIKLETQEFARKWKEFKDKNKYLDFTDLIEKSLNESIYAPGQPNVIFADEAQDFTPLQLKLLRSWGQHTDWIVLTGDDDQCQPAGEMVLTTKGYKDIKKLNPETDRLAVYDRNGARVYLGRYNGGYSFKKAKRQYKGKIYDIYSDGKKTAATAGHKWLARWHTKAKKVYCVYLMERNMNFRIGWCKLIRSDGNFHLGTRARLEKAEKAWILKITVSKQKASLFESFYSTAFGISTATFEPVNSNRGYLNKDFIKSLFSMLEHYDCQWDRAEKLLESLSKSLINPFWSKKDVNRGGAQTMTVQSRNLIPEIMLIPSHEEKSKVKWRPIDKMKTREVDIPVYSLDVDKYQTYITNGLITHNCIYSFTGASPNAFLNPPIPKDLKFILTQSYRIPAKIHEKAQKIVKKISVREEKEYKPRNSEGVVRSIQENYKRPDRIIHEIINGIEQYPDKTFMVLASCSYMINPLKKILKDEGVPFHNPYRTIRSDWNPLSRSSKLSKRVTPTDMLLNFLNTSDDNFWNIPQFVSWVKNLKVGQNGLIYKQGKNAVKTLKEAIKNNAPGLHTAKNVVSDVLTPEAIKPAIERNTDWLFENISEKKQAALKFPLKILKKYGKEGLSKRPKVIIGTIHSVKGGEADCVFLYPDISAEAASTAVGNQIQRDAIYRVFYVGMTRAREELILMNPVIGKKGMYVELN